MIQLQDDTIGNFRRVEEGEECIPEEALTPLASYVLSKFNQYEDNRTSSGIEDNIVSSLRAYNQEYSQNDLNKIAEEGSSPIYVGLTSAKCRALSAFIKDILLGSERPYSIEPTPVPKLPEKIEAQLTEYFKTKKPTEEADLKSINKHRRDLENSLREEINLLTKHAFSHLEDKTEDNLVIGDFYKALSEVIDDFSWSPTAILKGPIVTRKNRLTWVNGEAKVKPEYIFFNRRVNPLDWYPSPDGSNTIEKVRFSVGDLEGLYGVPGYNPDVLDTALESPTGTRAHLSTAVDQDIRDEEMQGSTENEDEIQGLHFFGAIPGYLLEEWDIPSPGKIANVEVILLGNEVLKVCINKDPLNRKPYFTASYQQRPGSQWGTSLPSIMEPEQRMCNATVRALALNLGLSASPQCMISIDRLADNGDISEVYGGKIWQVKSDPTGNSGRPLDFFNVPSNAQELLAVFTQFMQLADETTGIPRYSYGQGQQMGGAGATSSGLAMMLENTTKTIKDAIRHVDEGIIVPRIEYEFYNIMMKESSKYTGDICVTARGSQALANRSAETLKRNEFIAVTGNKIDQQIMGTEGRAVLLREMAKTLNLPESVVPSDLELREKEAKAAEGSQKQMELEREKIGVPIKVAEIQTSGVQVSADVRSEKNQVDREENMQDYEIAKEELVLESKKTQGGWASEQESNAIKAAGIKQKADDTNKSIALSLKTMGSPYHDKSQK